MNEKVVGESFIVRVVFSCGTLVFHNKKHVPLAYMIRPASP
jgi:hypothetical protein